MTTSALSALIDELGAGVVVTDPEILASYRYDWARDPDAGMPLAVVRPISTEQVQTVLRWASAHLVPVVPRGAGTGLSGGSTAVDGGIVLSTVFTLFLIPLIYEYADKFTKRGRLERGRK